MCKFSELVPGSGLVRSRLHACEIPVGAAKVPVKAINTRDQSRRLFMLDDGGKYYHSDKKLHFSCIIEVVTEDQGNNL